MWEYDQFLSVCYKFHKRLLCFVMQYQFKKEEAAALLNVN